MSESSHHRILVEALAKNISDDSVWASPPLVYCDLLNEIGTSNLPPAIGSHRPDVFARDILNSFLIIGEAKTDGDIDNNHTLLQLTSFFDYLRTQKKAELWMSVPWLSAGTAMRVCRKARKLTDSLHVPFRVVAYMMGDTAVRREWRE
jgi:hypothetical protein